MFGTIICCIKGSCRLKAEGRFPERILNIASTSGIYVHNVTRINESTITFSVSKKGSDKLLSHKLEGLSLEVTESFGIPFVMKKHKKRVLLYFLPVLLTVTAFVFSLFIWRIQIEGGDKALQTQVKEIISENGIYVGALKHKINQYEVKRNAILSVDDLIWLWVDIKGSTAKVKIQKRKPLPDMYEIHESGDVIAMHSGVIEKMQVYCGQPLVKEGMTVEKGQIIITGVFRSEKENIPTYYHHASGNVILRVYRDKSFVIPKKTIAKTPTGNKKDVFKINFKKNHIKFSLNSGIPYTEYDKIEKKYKLPLLPISFSKITYEEALSETLNTDIEKEVQKCKDLFKKELVGENMEIVSFEQESYDGENEYTVTFKAQCLVRTDKEVPLS